MLRFRVQVLRFRVRVLRFRVFGCFVLRSSFSSASFSTLPVTDIVERKRRSPTTEYNLKFHRPKIALRSPWREYMMGNLSGLMDVAFLR